MALNAIIVDPTDPSIIAGVASGRLLVTTQGGASGGTASIDDGAFTAGVDSGTPAMGFFSADTVDANDVGVLAMDASRRLLVSIEVDNAGIGGGTEYNIQDVQGATDTGKVGLAVRNDVLADLSGGDGAYTPLQVNSLGALYTSIRNNNTISTDNSSAATLGIDAVFTGTSEDISMHSSISVQVFASHASATSGLSMEFSTDGSNWDEKHTATVAASTEREFIFPVHANFFRIVYTNGGTGQTAFRLQTILHVQGIPGSAHALDANVAADSVGTLTKSVIIAQAAGSGEFVPVQATAGANLKIALEEIDAALLGGGVEAGALLVTIASDSTGVLSVDDNGGSLTVDSADLATIAGAVVAGQMQVDVVAALPVGSNTIGVVDLGATDNAVLDAIAASVAIMDDWDETNRAAVNLIASQAGVAGGTGVDAATVLRVSLATDIALPAGTNAIGKLAPNSGVDIGDVDVTSISAGANLIGDVGLSGARTSGGTTIFRSIDLDEGTLEVVKASAGQLYWMHVINLASAVRFVKIYNATSGTIGTGAPVLTFPIPTQGDTNGAGFTLSIPNGVAFATGISIGASTGIADADTGAPGANEVVVNLGFA